MIGELICQYCAHRNGSAESRCAHCGAPLAATLVREAATGIRDAAAVAHEVEDVRRLPREAGAAGASRLAREAGMLAHSLVPQEKSPGKAEPAPGNRLEALIERRLENLGWPAVAVVLAVLLVAALLLMRGCSSLNMPVVGQVSAVEALPVALHTAASCASLPGENAGARCTIPATSTLLAGALTAGQELSFSLQVQRPDQLSATVAGWRAGGGVVLADGTVFAGIGPSATVRYADARTGIRIETSTFAGRAAAQTFLNRTGLVQ